MVTRKSVTIELREGLKYMTGQSNISFLLLAIAILSLLVYPYNTLLPAFTIQVFHGNARIFGYLNSCIGCGAIMGTIFLASLRSTAPLKRILFVNIGLSGLALIAFSFAGRLDVALALCVLAGFSIMTQSTLVNTIIQTTSLPAMRGRIISYFALSIFGMMPLGALFIGVISQHAGIQYTVLGEGMAALVIFTVFARFLVGKQRGRFNDYKLIEPKSIDLN